MLGVFGWVEVVEVLVTIDVVDIAAELEIVELAAVAVLEMFGFGGPIAIHIQPVRVSAVFRRFAIAHHAVSGGSSGAGPTPLEKTFATIYSPKLALGNLGKIL